MAEPSRTQLVDTLAELRKASRDLLAWAEGSGKLSASVVEAHLRGALAQADVLLDPPRRPARRRRPAVEPSAGEGYRSGRAPLRRDDEGGNR